MEIKQVLKRIDTFIQDHSFMDMVSSDTVSIFLREVGTDLKQLENTVLIGKQIALNDKRTQRRRLTGTDPFVGRDIDTIDIKMQNWHDKKIKEDKFLNTPKANSTVLRLKSVLESNKPEGVTIPEKKGPLKFSDKKILPKAPPMKRGPKGETKKWVKSMTRKKPGKS